MQIKERKEVLKRFYKPRLLLIALAIVGVTIMLSGVAFAVSYNLNKTIPATVEILPTPTPTPIEVTLYTDALATNPLPQGYTHDFGDVMQGGTPQNPLWFRASEINPSTINVVGSGLPVGASIDFMVGTPINSMAGHPCTLALWLTNFPIGVSNFNFTVTGTSNP